MIKIFHKLALISTITYSLVAWVTPASAETTINCESNGNRYNFCNANTRGGVRLVRQLSGTECKKGDNWGYDENGIWVDRGCRAQFAVRNNNNYNNNNYNNNNYNNNYNNDYGYNNPPTNQSLTCNSDRGGYTRCSADISRGDRVIMKRQLSSSGCWEGDTWGYDRDGIWVDGGCRAVFEIKR